MWGATTYPCRRYLLLAPSSLVTESIWIEFIFSNDNLWVDRYQRPLLSWHSGLTSTNLSYRCSSCITFGRYPYDCMVYPVACIPVKIPCWNTCTLTCFLIAWWIYFQPIGSQVWKFMFTNTESDKEMSRCEGSHTLFNALVEDLFILIFAVGGLFVNATV